MAYADCIKPSALPRCSARQVSAISAAAVVHSPPIPSPSTNRKKPSCGMVCVNAQAALEREYTRIEAINARVLPMRSARKPNRSPPIADAMSVSEFRKPALRVSIENSRNRYAMTSEKSITSIASSIQPRPPATKVRRSAAVMSRGKENPVARCCVPAEAFAGVEDEEFNIVADCTECPENRQNHSSRSYEPALSNNLIACPPRLCYAPAHSGTLGGTPWHSANHVVRKSGLLRFVRSAAPARVQLLHRRPPRLRRARGFRKMLLDCSATRWGGLRESSSC